MLKRIRAALTARSTVLALLLLLAAAMTVAAIVPQGGMEGAATAGAAKGAPAVRPGLLVSWLGLNHVFSTQWFAVLSLVFVTSLSFSTLEQFRLARARMFRPPSDGREEGVPSSLSPDAMQAILAGEGYRRVAVAPSRARFVRLWPGYWGNFLLHAGMTLTVLFSITYVLTEHRARLHLVSGQASQIVPGTYPTRRGLLARELPLPAEVNLYRVQPTFGANDQLVDLGSHVIFTDGTGASRELQVAVNEYQDYRGLIVYQLVKYGNAFFVEVEESPGQPVPLVLEMAFPDKRGAASYVNQALGGAWTLKAKYYASGDRSQVQLKDPQLVLRLYEGERLVEEAALQEGQAARLGPMGVRLVRVGWWTELLFEGSLGTPGIFAGFGVLLLGGVLTFFAVPREVVVRATPSGNSVHWRTTRFPELYREEGDRIISRCSGGQAS